MYNLMTPKHNPLILCPMCNKGFNSRDHYVDHMTDCEIQTKKSSSV